MGADPLKSGQVPAAEGESGEDRATAVSRLFREHNRVLIGFLAARLQNEHEAQEVAQEAYVKLLQLERTGAVSFLRAYLFRVAENLAVDRLRHRGHETRYHRMESLNESLGYAPVEEEAVAKQELDLLNAVLAELPPKCAEAFRLHRLEDMPSEQIAARIGVTDRMVRKYVARTLIYTRLRLDGLSPDEARARLKS